MGGAAAGGRGLKAVDDSILIVGTGAMACLFGSRLSAAGVQVTMLGTWMEGLEALRGHGVRVVDGDGQDQRQEGAYFSEDGVSV